MKNRVKTSILKQDDCLAQNNIPPAPRRPEGPIIGVLTTDINRYKTVRPRGVQAEVAYISKLGKTMQIQLYIFTPYDIDWHRKTVRGYNFKEDNEGCGHWECRKYPLPDVVYDLIHNRAAEIKYSAVRERLKKYTEGRYFNPGLFNKLKIYSLLITDPELRTYLPDTRRLDSAETLEHMISLYNTVYLKPVCGSLGRGIIRVQKIDDAYYFKTRGCRTGHAGSISELLKKTAVTRGKRAYLVQQGLDLVSIDGKIVDVRALMQKNGRGEWTVTKMYTRVGPPGNITSNLASGGIAYPIDNTLSGKFGALELESIKKELRTLAFKACHTLERITGELFGEIGIDMGLDSEKKIWLIELNSKPRRTTVSNGNARLIELSFVRPLRFALFLAGYQKQKSKRGE